MNLFGVLFTVLVVVLLAGLGLVAWGLVEVWRDERRLAKERARAERRRIERDASLVAGRLRQRLRSCGAGRDGRGRDTRPT